VLLALDCDCASDSDFVRLGECPWQWQPTANSQHPTAM